MYSPIPDSSSAAAGPAELFPLYSVTPSLASRTDNLSCSKNDQFCYLCQYSQETGLATDIRDHIQVLARRGFELPAIVASTKRIYDSELKKHAVHVNAAGQTIKSPEWSLDSITTHLLMSSEFQDSIFYRTYIGNIFQHLIRRQTDRMILSGGQIDEESRKSLLDSIREMGRWRSSAMGKSTSSDTTRSAGKKTKR